MRIIAGVYTVNLMLNTFKLILNTIERSIYISQRRRYIPHLIRVVSGINAAYSFNNLGLVVSHVSEKRKTRNNVHMNHSSQALLLRLG